MDYLDSQDRDSESHDSLPDSQDNSDVGHPPQKRLSIIKHGEQGHVFIDLHILCSVIGFGSFCAWGYLIFYSLMLSPQIDSTNCLIFLIVYSTGITMALLAGWFFPKIYFTGTRVLIGITIVASLAMLLALYLPSHPDTFYVSCVAWYITGVGVASLFGLWSDLVATQRSGTLRSYVSLAMLLASVQVPWVMLLRAEVLPLFIFLAPVASLALCCFLRRSSLLSKRMAHMNKKEATTKMTISWQSMLNTVAIGAVIGFSLSWLLHIKISTSIVIAIAVMSCLIDGAIFIDINTKKYFGENVLMKIFPVTVLIGLLPMIFFGDTGRTICAAFVCAVAPLFIIQGVGGCFEHIVLHRQSPPNTAAYGRLYSYLGIGLGLSIGFGAFQTTIFGENTAGIFIAMTAIAAVLITLFAMAKNRFPIDEKADAELLFFQTDQILKDNPNATEEDIERALVKGKRAWKKRCDHVAEQYSLSSRQIEVFRLLARGRNAEYITEELVISPHTTKAHIYSIYQKLDVHSRQELISLIEQTDISPEPNEGIPENSPLSR